MCNSIPSGKAATFFAFAVFFFPIILFGQTISNPSQNDSNYNYWSLAYMGGTSFSLIDRTNNQQYYSGYQTNNLQRAGWNIGLDMLGSVDRNLGIFFSTSYTSLSTHNTAYSNYSFFEITFGPRFFDIYNREKYFIEAGMGNYWIFKSSRAYSGVEPYSYYSSEEFSAPDMGFGLNVGAGVLYSLTNNTDLLLRCKIHYALPVLKSVLYAGINTGIVFNNGKDQKKESTVDENNKAWSFTLSGGIYIPAYSEYYRYSTSGTTGLEIARKAGQSYEIFGKLNYNYIGRDVDYFSHYDLYLIDVSLGPRFYFGEKNTKVFMEIGSGVYYYTSQATYFFRDALSGGFNLGTGIKQKLNGNVSLVLKSNAHLLFSVRNYPAAYITATGGIRLEI